jgi:hypothetical protein
MNVSGERTGFIVKVFLRTLFVSYWLLAWRFDPEDGSMTLLRNLSQLPDYTVSHSGKKCPVKTVNPTTTEDV